MQALNLNTEDSHYLKPGDYFITSEKMIVKTVLGSCITVTMYSPESGLSAACHAVLPSCKGCSCPPGVCMNRYKYVQCVIPEMLKQFNNKGISTNNIEIKMFGGADMIMIRKGCDSWKNHRVGRQNILMARKVAHKHKLQFKSQDIGGTLGRKIYFDTNTGKVWLKRLSKSLQNDELGGTE